jgi:hypothetical protein
MFAWYRFERRHGKAQCLLLVLSQEQSGRWSAGGRPGQHLHLQPVRATVPVDSRSRTATPQRASGDRAGSGSNALLPMTSYVAAELRRLVESRANQLCVLSVLPGAAVVHWDLQHPRGIVQIIPQPRGRMRWLARSSRMSTPTQPPTASELLASSEVMQALTGAWADSQVNDPTDRHEEGGWIYLDLSNGAIATTRASAGTQNRLSLANPPVLPNHVIVGTFHTHPNPASEGWEIGPSIQDERAANYTGVPWLIRAEDGDYSAGPVSRRGGLGGGPGYPP